MTYYKRNLPHWLPEHATFFVTWRLYGALPLHKRTARNGCATSAVGTAGEQFRRFDQLLDSAGSGPHWLNNPDVASRVMELMEKGEQKLGYFLLHAFVIMPNHVHVLLTPKLELRWITNGPKGATAREGNRLLDRTGELFWQDESYDHCVRSEEEFGKIFRYVENNPVSAGLVRRAEDWLWSSARRRKAAITL